MSALLRKLQFKEHARIYVHGAPSGLEPVLKEMAEVAPVSTTAGCRKKDTFAIFFAEDRAAIAKAAARAARKVEGDGVLWFAYPKQSSKRYSTDISRDLGWQPLGDLGFEAVRQVAIDDDWSALRFRRVEFIRELRRDKRMALSKEGRSRTK